MKRTELVDYLNTLLRIAEIQDYGPQGLQIEGKDEINKIVATVDAHQPCVDAALAHGADMLLVHHGIFWSGHKMLQGSFGKLVRTFIKADLNLYAAHLPLDAHQEFGNNAELPRRLGLTVDGWWANIKGTDLGSLCTAPAGTTLDSLVARFEKSVGPVKAVLAHGPATVQRVGIISGFGAPHIQEAADLGCDTFLTGETSHSQYYDALNAGINVIYGGHYTTETVGVQALGQHLAEKFGIEFEFVDLPTGM